MGTFAVQFLEDRPEIANISAGEVRARLRDAFRRLPISLVLVGWNVQGALLDVCVEACAGAGVRLFRWHPLLTGDGKLIPQLAWQTVGLNGEKIPGFRGMPEFTFVCPNQPVAREAVLAHLSDVLRDARYQGVFLDRIRFPSPAENPESELGCFCKGCQRAAAAEGLDLMALREGISQLVANPEGAGQYVRGLLNEEYMHEDIDMLQAFLDFRCRSVTHLLEEAAGVAHKMGKKVGLDCFSPSLVRMVGQDLRGLNARCDWVKIMSYGHALGPAGVPFELLALADWLIEGCGFEEGDMMALLAEATRLPLPMNRAALRVDGLAPDALRMEAERGRTMGVEKLLAGIELVEMPGVSELHEQQIRSDLAAFREAGADGLVLSWDLWLIPPERLDIVREVW
jgi:hypothetical protein